VADRAAQGGVGAEPSGPRTTVVLAVWDDYVSDRLEQAIASLRAQEPSPPLVIVDNASERPLPPLPGALVVRAPARLTAGAARNLGLNRVSTPYVAFWDADDVMLPGTLAVLEASLAADARLVAFAMAILEEPTRTRHRWPRRWVARLLRAPRAFGMLHAVWSLYPSTGATIMRTDVAKAAGGYGDADFGEDASLTLSLAFRGRLGWTEQPGRLYRLHSESLWAQNMTPRHLRRHARAIRARLRSDPAVPLGVRVFLPLIWLAQEAAIGAHVGVERLRQQRLSSGRQARTVNRSE
jgi:hypothetical protein